MICTGTVNGLNFHAFGLIVKVQSSSTDGALFFADQAPGLAGRWTQARKVLSPTKEGFEERLEVDSGNGCFVPYYVVRMRRIAT